MILWIIKQLLSLRQAVMGRSRPSELAWGLAIGIGIGLIPKGNLVSLVLIGSLVTLRVNHGMAALGAVTFSFLAGGLDPWTHELGATVLGAERVRLLMGRVWSWPLMPWTELNNTVVMGSTLVAALALLPSYALSLPLFRWIAQRPQRLGGDADPPPAEGASLAADQPIEAVSAPLAVFADSLPAPIDPAPSEAADHVETQIDVIRLKSATSDDDAVALESEPISGGQMNEALGYLLRRLRDSRQGKAA